MGCGNASVAGEDGNKNEDGNKIYDACLAGDLKMGTVVKNLFLLLTLGAVVGCLGYRFPELAKGTDFVHFYAAARMIKEGAGHRLYDFALQQQFQARYAGRIGTYYVHPPFETLIYLPFALLPLSRAYLLWSALNAALLMVTARVLQVRLFGNWDWRLMGLMSLLFVPVLVTLQQGQDSILLLFFLVCAFAAAQEKKEFTAGCLIAGGLCKFQLAFPLFLMLLPGRSRKFIAGFAAVAGLLVLVSVALCGWGVFGDYSHCLLTVSGVPQAAVHPRAAMANLRGLADLVSSHHTGLSAPITVVGSVLILWFAVRGWYVGSNSEASLNLLWANAALGAMLAGYYQSPCDLTLLLLPMLLIPAAVMQQPQPWWTVWIGLELLLFLPPLHLVLLTYHQYSYATIPLLFLFALTYIEIRRSAGASRHP